MLRSGRGLGAENAHERTAGLADSLEGVRGHAGARAHPYRIPGTGSFGFRRAGSAAPQGAGAGECDWKEDRADQRIDNHRGGYRSAGQPDLLSNRIHRRRPLVEQHFQHAEIRKTQFQGFDMDARVLPHGLVRLPKNQPNPQSARVHSLPPILVQIVASIILMSRFIPGRWGSLPGLRPTPRRPFAVVKGFQFSAGERVHGGPAQTTGSVPEIPQRCRCWREYVGIGLNSLSRTLLWIYSDSAGGSS